MNNFHTVYGPFSAAQVAEKLGLTTQGENINSPLVGIMPLAEAGREHLSFLDNPAYKKHAATTGAGAVILKKEAAQTLPKGVVAIISLNPYADYARALGLFYQLKTETAETSVQPNAYVHPTAKIGKGTVIEAGAYVGAYVKIGENCHIGAHVSLQCAEVGNHTIIHPGARIGQDGFGFAQDGASVIKVPQVGKVVVGNNVEIGANTTIDRAALGETYIGDDCKLDNLVQIGHNVKMGKGCQVVAQSAIAGSTILGNGVVVGGQSGIAGHLNVADGTMLAGQSGLTKSVAEKGLVLAGFPAMPIQRWRKLQASLARTSRKKETS